MAALFNFCAHRHCEHNIPLGHNATSDFVLCSLSFLSGKFDIVSIFISSSVSLVSSFIKSLYLSMRFTEHIP